MSTNIGMRSRWVGGGGGGGVAACVRLWPMNVKFIHRFRLQIDESRGWSKQHTQGPKAVRMKFNFNWTQHSLDSTFDLIRNRKREIFHLLTSACTRRARMYKRVEKWKIALHFTLFFILRFADDYKLARSLGRGVERFEVLWTQSMQKTSQDLRRASRNTMQSSLSRLIRLIASHPVYIRTWFCLSIKKLWKYITKSKELGVECHISAFCAERKKIVYILAAFAVCFLRAYQASSREVKMKLRQFHSRFNWISECLRSWSTTSDCNETRSSQLIIPKQGGAAKRSRETHNDKFEKLQNCN